MQDLKFTDAKTLAKQLAEELASRMRKMIEKEGEVAVAFSGGSTPAKFLQELSKQSLEWKKVTVTLVDERWCDETDPASNARLIKDNLLQDEAKKAWFVPLKNNAATPVDGFMECENRLHEQIKTLHYAVLGMGTDGHCASWFPNSKALNDLLSDDQRARCQPVMDAPHFAQRMSLTWSFLSTCKHLFLHFEGEEKNKAFAKVGSITDIKDIESMPVRKLLSQGQVELTVYRTRS